ncbi:MAG: methylmalonyl-CoA epimerase [Chloroflexi bacterium]|nr:MAG: methylmalonyl-CoA epimerase [Chloroflexota bacterium]
MGIEGLLKVGIAVKDLEEAKRLFGQVFGLASEGEDTYEPLSMRYSLSSLGNMLLELIQPTGPEGPIARFIKNHGEGLQHICFTVSDIEEVMKQLKQQGIEFVPESPFELDAAFGRAKFAFARPRAFNGVIVEFVEVVRPAA